MSVDDICPLTEFKRNAARMITQMKVTGRPMTLTVNGKPSVVVSETTAWQNLQERLDRAETVAGIGRGLAQAQAGQGIEAGEFFSRLAQSN